MRSGSQHHADYCREQFRRGSEALTILLAVDDDDAPVGKVHLDFEAREHENAALLLAAAVIPALQGRGVGTQLIAAAEHLGCVRGLETVVLGVEDSNPRARRLYERLGYVVVGADDFVYVGAPVPNPAVWMRKELRC